MGDKENRQRLAGPEIGELAIESGTRDLVERTEWLVHEQQRRFGHERAGDRRAHLHAAGELPRVRAPEMREADQSEGTLHALGSIGHVSVPQLERQAHVPLDVGPGHQRRALKDEGETTLRSPFETSGVGPQAHAAARRRKESRNHSQERALAAARRADDGRELAFANAKRHGVESAHAVREDLVGGGDVDDGHECTPTLAASLANSAAVLPQRGHRSRLGAAW